LVLAQAIAKAGWFCWLIGYGPGGGGCQALSGLILEAKGKGGRSIAHEMKKKGSGVPSMVEGGDTADPDAKGLCLRPLCEACIHAPRK